MTCQRGIKACDHPIIYQASIQLQLLTRVLQRALRAGDLVQGV